MPASIVLLSRRALRRALPQPLRFRIWELRQESRAPTSRRRWARQPVARPAAAVGGVRQRLARREVGVDRLLAVRFINMASRPDRREVIESDLERLGIRVERFEAIADANGALGCTLSHVACIEPFAGKQRGCVMVCEDDAWFKVGRRNLDYLVDRFLDDDRAEVACLAFGGDDMVVSPHSSVFMRGRRIRGTACYLVKTSIVAELRSVWLEGAAALAAGGRRMHHTVDMAWHPLQERRVFLVPIVRVVRQRPGWSDIAQRYVDFGS